MRSVTYELSLNGKPRTFTITQLNGGHGWQLYLDKFYQGAVQRVNGDLVAHLNPNASFTGDDLAGIFEVIEREFKSS